MAANDSTWNVERALSPRQTTEAVRDFVARFGAQRTAHFADLYQLAVEHGISLDIWALEDALDAGEFPVRLSDNEAQAIIARCTVGVRFVCIDGGRA